MSAIANFRRLFNRKPSTNRHSKRTGPQLTLQNLEQRSLMSATFDPAEGILRIGGTDAADVIRIANNAGQVSVDGQDIALPDGQVVSSLPVAEILYARVDGLAGNDRIEMVQTDVTPETALVMEADGNAGGDTLVGGAADDRLYGGADNDQLVGGAGDDLLDGGGQDDALFAASAIDGSALLRAYFSVDYVEQDASAPFGVDLAPGEHLIYTHGSSVAWFNVANDGSFSYDPKFEGVLSGQGTSALSVNGVEVHIDATALLSGYMSLDHAPQDPGEPIATRLLPGDHFIYTHGNAMAWFKVTDQGTIAYDPALEGVLTGQGTNSLTVNGAEVQIDPTALWPGYMTLDYVVQDPSTIITTRLLPGDHFIYTHGSAIAWFNVANNGAISYDSALEGSLTGRGTNSLKLNGQIVAFSPAALAETALMLDFVAIDALKPFQANLLPGDHSIYTAEGHALNFTLGSGGIIASDPGLQGVVSDISAVLGLDGILRVTGSNAANQIRIVQEKDRLRVDGVYISIAQPDGTFTYDSSVDVFINGVEVQALGGADTVSMNTTAAQVLYFPVTVYGGDGNDSLQGASGKDTLVGGNGNDLLKGGDDEDWLWGQDGNDVIYGDNGNDAVDGQRGNDTLNGGAGNDVISGNEGSDRVEGGLGDDEIWGAAYQNNYTYQDGDNYLAGDEGNNHLFGGNANDKMYGGQGHEYMAGGDGADSMSGYGGNDTMLGGNGDDKLYGGFGDDYLLGDDGEDSLYGEYNNDALDGGRGNDLLEGGWENDSLVGGEGLDILAGGFGSDTLFGAGWQSTYAYQDAGNYLFGEDGDDNLYGGNGNDYMSGGTGDDGLFGDMGFNTLIGGADDDRFLTWSAAADTVSDSGSRDATIRFVNSPAMNNVPPPDGWPTTLPYNYNAGAWTSTEIYFADQAFKNLHHTTANTRMLAMPSDSEYTFIRRGQQTSGDWDYGGQNNGSGSITIGQARNATLATDSMQQTIYHEIGHSWGGSDVNSRYQLFLNISGWVQNPGDKKGLTQGTDTDSAVPGNQNTWWYRTGADFARDYAELSPGEDYATTWETLFMDRFHNTLMGNDRLQFKYYNLDLLFGDLRT